METDGCPCLYTTPCHEFCCCAKPMMSFACRYCCKYGSPKQQKVMAATLAGFIEAGWASYENFFGNESDEHK